jgi:hypothetical protein
MATTIKRILCFGDSFVADSRLYHAGDKAYQAWTNKHWGSNNAWLDELAEKLDCSINHVGIPGAGPGDVFWQLSNFLAHDELLETDLVIITWSQYSRDKDATGKPLRHYSDYDPVTEAKMYEAVKMFFLHIFNDYERFNAYNMSVNAVDNLLRNVKSKVFHFYCFDIEFARQVPEHIQPHVYQFNAPKTGHLCTAFCLSGMCAKYYKGDMPSHTWWRREEGDEHPNHLGPLANAELIEYIKDRL